MKKLRVTLEFQVPDLTSGLMFYHNLFNKDLIGLCIAAAEKDHLTFILGKILLEDPSANFIAAHPATISPSPGLVDAGGVQKLSPEILP